MMTIWRRNYLFSSRNKDNVWWIEIQKEIVNSAGKIVCLKNSIMFPYGCVQSVAQILFCETNFILIVQHKNCLCSECSVAAIWLAKLLCVRSEPVAV